MKQILNSFHIFILMLLKKIFGSNNKDELDLLIQPYHSYADEKLTRIRVMGRVIRSYTNPNYSESSNRYIHFVKTVRLFLALGVEDAEVIVEIGREKFNIKTNKKGFFNEVLELDTPAVPLSSDSSEELPWVKITYFIKAFEIDSIKESYTITPKKRTNKIYISDIDDTILKSKATSFLSMALKTLFYPPRKRVAFPDVARAYKKLQSGPDSQEHNLFFYVSSSTWDIFPLLQEFIKINKFPQGPIILQDLSSKEDNVSAHDHEHKVHRISEIARMYEETSLVLIGDAGQADSDIYLSIAEKYPSRVEKILIRRTWWQKVSQDPTEYKERAKDLGVVFRYFDNLENIDEQE